jgi:NADH:ubiquinone oxidoreductase subunit B-like Fe-S oxidoreductase
MPAPRWASSFGSCALKKWVDESIIKKEELGIQQDINA